MGEETNRDAKEKWEDARKLVKETVQEGAKIAADSDNAMDATNMFTVKIAKRQVGRVSRRLKILKKREKQRRKAYYKTERKTTKAERKVSRTTKDFIRKTRKRKKPMRKRAPKRQQRTRRRRKRRRQR